MTEENKKRINKLIIPFTKRTLSFLTAATMLATGIVGCKEKEEKDKDTSSIISTVSDEEITSSDKELTIDDNIQLDTNEELDTVQNNNEVTNNITSNNNNKVNSNNSNKNNQTNNSTVSNNTNNTSSVTTPSVNTPVETPSASIEPTMPSALTADNINDVEVFKHFAKEFRKELGSNMINYNGKITDGKEEFQLMIALLNYEYLNADVMYELFNNYTLDEFKQLWSFTDALLSKLLYNKKIFNYTKYCINREFGNNLVKVQEQYVNNKTALKNSLLDYYIINSNSSFKYQNTNLWIEYYMFNILYYDINSEELQVQELIDVIFDARYIMEEYTDNCVIVYNNMRNKIKVKN